MDYGSRLLMTSALAAACSIVIPSFHQPCNPTRFVGNSEGMWLLVINVAVEKVPLSRNSENLGERKCLGKLRKSFVGLPNAEFFRPFSGEGVFQQPLALTLIDPAIA